MTRRVLKLTGEAVLPSDVKPDDLVFNMVVMVGKWYAELECGHRKHLYNGVYGETETCFECEAK